MSIPGTIPDRTLRGEERTLYVKTRRVLWGYEPLRASHAQLLVDVQGRNIRLLGRVRTVVQKIMAELLVRRMPEVDGVTSEIVSDPEVVRSVADALARDERTAPYVILVDARHGMVTLRGRVATEAARAAALQIVAETPLVVEVRSEIAVGGPSYPPCALPAQAAPTGTRPPMRSAA